MRIATIVLLSLVLAGCAARHPHGLGYRFENGVLYPPAPAAKGKAAIRFTTAAPERRNRSKECAIRDDSFRLEWRGRTARVNVFCNPVDSDALEKLRSEFDGKGCLAPGEGVELGRRIVENAPIPQGDLTVFLYGMVNPKGFVDLGPGTRLNMVAPILRGGPDALDRPSSVQVAAAQSGGTVRMQVDMKRPELLGVETAYYDVAPDPDTRGNIVRLAGVDHLIDGVATHPAEPQRDYLKNAPPGQLRLVYLTRRSNADHNITLLAARSRHEIERMTHRLQNEPNATCDVVACITIPAQVALRADLRVEVNGSQQSLDLGATVADALRSAHADPGQVLRTMKLWRLYAGKLVPLEFPQGEETVLRLRLVGGEKLAW